MSIDGAPQLKFIGYELKQFKQALELESLYIA